MTKNLRLKRSREYMGLSQDQLAEKIGSTRGYIAQLEGSKEFSYKKVVELSRVLGLNPTWLETGKGVQFVTDSKPQQESEINKNSEWLTNSGNETYSMSTDIHAGLIFCQSLNPDKQKYPDFEISLDDIFRIFSVIKEIKTS